jgi:hypothetical protein
MEQERCIGIKIEMQRLGGNDVKMDLGHPAESYILTDESSDTDQPQIMQQTFIYVGL